MSLCNATKQELLAVGLEVIGLCPVSECGFPVARHRDDSSLHQTQAGGGITLEQLDKKLDEHFLKQFAPINKALKLIITELLDPWERIHSETESVVEAAELRNLDPVSNFYETPKKAMCMVLGKATNCQIKCAHIWPRCTLGRGLEAFDLNDADVNNPRNFLRLHRDIERAFDRKRLVFVPEALGADGEVLLKVVILDPRLHSEDLTFNDTTVQFSTVHNQLFSYTFVSNKMPYTTLLANHALQATNKAKSLAGSLRMIRISTSHVAKPLMWQEEH